MRRGSRRKIKAKGLQGWKIIQIKITSPPHVAKCERKPQMRQKANTVVPRNEGDTSMAEAVNEARNTWAHAKIEQFNAGFSVVVGIQKLTIRE